MIAHDTRRAELDADTRLMLEVRSGSDVAFERLFARHRPWVTRYLRSVGDDRSDDLTQEVFLRVFRSRRTYRPTAKFSTWLFRIVVNVARNAARDRAARRVVVLGRMPEDRRPCLPELVMAPSVESPEYRLRRKELLADLKRAIGKLNPRQKTALELFAFEGHSYEQTARRMATSSHAVKSLLARARANLSRRLASTEL